MTKLRAGATDENAAQGVTRIRVSLAELVGKGSPRTPLTPAELNVQPRKVSLGALTEGIKGGLLTRLR